MSPQLLGVFVCWQRLCLFNTVRGRQLETETHQGIKAFLWAGVLQGKAAACCSGMRYDLGNAAWRDVAPWDSEK